MRNSRLFFTCAGLWVSSWCHAALPIWTTDLHRLDLSFEVTPDLSERQYYLEASPIGVGAKQAWALEGGTGSNVKIIDIETGFRDTHEEFRPHFFLGNNPQYSDHGTAVMGILNAQSDNALGIVGIAHGAAAGFYGFIEGNQDRVDQAYIDGIVTGIRAATEQLDAGDVLVIEQHMMGPDQDNWTAVEYWLPIFEALKAATEKGIHCVEAAGNGGSDFDDESYEGAFDLSVRDSGCIMVGAGAKGTHERLSFSNFGSRLDAHGYGNSVPATGYGDLFNGGVNAVYTARFSGTSSATPIVAGAVALVSSIAEGAGLTITPAQMRAALRSTGTPQGISTSAERIGSMPDIQQILSHFGIR